MFCYCFYLFFYLFFFFFFFFNDTATTEIYTLSLHDALPIFYQKNWDPLRKRYVGAFSWTEFDSLPRSEEHTSELQSLAYLVCRLLLEKKKKKQKKIQYKSQITCHSTHALVYS